MGWLTNTKRKRKPAGPAQPDQALNGGGTGAAPGAAAAPPAPARPGEAARTDAGAHEARGSGRGFGAGSALPVFQQSEWITELNF